MSEILLTTTPADGFRRLQVHGQAVVDMHHQLGTILGNRLGRQHAQLLSRPEVDPGGGIAWYAPALGPVRKLADLADAEHRSIETLRRRLLADIGELVREMRGESASAELVARMLELATITPSEDAAYAVGAQPVLVLWGHASEAQAVPEPPKFVGPSPAITGRGVPPAPAPEPVVAAAPEPPAVASASPAAHAETIAAMGAPARRHWFAWWVPFLLLLLLAFLLWRASQPLPPILVERQAPAPAPPADPVPAEQDKEKALRAELAELTRARDERLALCKPIAPPAATEPVSLPPPPKTAELAPPPPPAPKPKPAPPVAEAKPKSELPPKEAKPAPPEPPKDVAMAPMPPPMPPRSRCDLQVKPGDEPEVVVIVDGSGSMGEPYRGLTSLTSKMTVAKNAIANVVTGLPDPVDVALIDFSNCDQVRLDKFFPKAERPTLIGEVRGLQPDRGTPLARSIERAGNIVSGDVESTIVVVSDGEDTCGRDPCAAARAVKAKRPNITINVIDIGRGEGQAMMRCIASATGGKVLTPNDSLDMNNKVQQATRLPDTRNCK